LTEVEILQEYDESTDVCNLFLLLAARNLEVRRLFFLFFQIY